MTTKEFIKKAELFGYKCEENEHEIIVLEDRGVFFTGYERVAIVNKSIQGVAKIIDNTAKTSFIKLMNAIIAYIGTSIEKR